MKKSPPPVLDLGGVRLHLLDDGTFKLDAGAMFGIVPRVLWGKHVCPDAENRLALPCRCPLVETDAALVLIDAGLGEKWSEKEKNIYQIGPRVTLLEQLELAGFSPAAVDWVVCTHLHLDHAGWLTRGSPPQPTFSQATVLVHAREWQAATATNALTAGSYRSRDFLPLEAAGKLATFDGENHRLVPRVRCFHTPGHTRGHLSVAVEGDRRTAVFPGENIPTRFHLRPAWVMSFDLEPERVLEQKTRLLEAALREDHLVLFNHDPELAVARLVRREDGRVVAEPVACPGSAATGG